MIDYTRSIREEIDLMIIQEVMVSIQDIISKIVEKKKTQRVGKKLTRLSEIF